MHRLKFPSVSAIVIKQKIRKNTAPEKLYSKPQNFGFLQPNKKFVDIY